MANIIVKKKIVKITFKVPEDLKELHDNNVKRLKQLAGVGSDLDEKFEAWFRKENKELAAKLDQNEKPIRENDEKESTQDKSHDQVQDQKDETSETAGGTASDAGAIKN